MESKSKQNKQKKRLESAKKNLDRIQETIKPYIKKNKVVRRSTAGKWSDGKSLTRQESFNILEAVSRPLPSQYNKKRNKGITSKSLGLYSKRVGPRSILNWTLAKIELV